MDLVAQLSLHTTLGIRMSSGRNSGRGFASLCHELGQRQSISDGFVDDCHLVDERVRRVRHFGIALEEA
jgi:hypothetical protein